MKATKFSLLGILSMLLVFTACQDDFTEEDLLNLQAELAEQAAANDHLRALAQIAAAHEAMLAEIAAEGSEDRATELYQDELEQAMDEWDRALDALDDEERRAEAMELLRQTGLVTSYTVRISDQGNALAGATVVLSGAGLQDTLTTDAQGHAVFADVPASIMTVDVSATDYISMRYLANLTNDGVDKDGEEGELVELFIDNERYYLANPREELVFVQMLSKVSGAPTATIKGSVMGNTDATTKDAEALSGIAVVANIESSLTGGFNLVKTQDGTAIDEVRFGPTEVFGNGTTDSLGNYSIAVPAFEDLDGDKIMYSVSFPSEVAANQTIAHLDGDSVRIIETAAVWGPFADATAAGIPTVYGFQTDFNAPPATTGSGFAISTPTKVSEAINGTQWVRMFDKADGVENDITDGDGDNFNDGSSEIIVTAVEGGNWQTTPRGTFANNGTNTTDFSYFELQWTYDSIRVLGSKDNYFNGTGSAPLIVGVVGNTIDASGSVTKIGNTDTIYFTVANITFTGNDVDTQTVDLTGRDYVVWEDTDDDLTTGTGIAVGNNFYEDTTSTFGYTGTTYTRGAAGTRPDLLVTSTFAFVGREKGAATTSTAPGITIYGTETTKSSIVVYSNSDVKYTDPSISWTSSTGTAPSVTVNRFMTNWAFGIAEGGTGYSSVPSGLKVTGTTATDAGDDKNDNYDETVSADLTNALEVIASSTSGTLESGSISGLLTVGGDSLKYDNASATSFRTTTKSITAPVLVTPASSTESADLYVLGSDIKADGDIDQIGGAGNGGTITGSKGEGYTAEISVAVNARTVASQPTGYTLNIAPTKAAVIELTGFTTDSGTKLVTWDGSVTISENGSGYIWNINQAADGQIGFEIDGPGAAVTDSNTSNTFTVDAGGTYTVDVDYGTGERSATLKGDAGVTVAAGTVQSGN